LQAQAHQALLERELQHAQAQRHAAEQQIAALRGEVERVAGALLDQSNPATLPLEQAA
jgi:hypothetical protein